MTRFIENIIKNTASVLINMAHFNPENKEITPTNWFKPWQPYDEFCEDENVILFKDRRTHYLDTKYRDKVNKWGDTCHDIERSIRELAFTVAASDPKTIDDVQEQYVTEEILYRMIKKAVHIYFKPPIEPHHIDWDRGQQ